MSNIVATDEESLKLQREIREELEREKNDMAYMVQDIIDSMQGHYLKDIAEEITSHFIPGSELGKIEYSPSFEVGPKPIIPAGFYKIQELKDRGRIADYYHKFVPSNCDCGCPLLSNENLSIIKCSNYRCHHAMAKSLLEMCRQFSVAGIGEITALSVIDDNGYKSVLDFIEQPPLGYREEVELITGVEKDYAECVRALNLPDLDVRALTIFKGINNYSEYREAIKKSGGLVEFLLDKVGGSGKLVSVLAPVLEAHDYELERIEKVFKLKKEALIEFPIAMSGSPYYAKAFLGASKLGKNEYMNYINQIYPEHVKFVRTESVLKAHYVLYDSDEVDTAKSREAQACGKLIDSVTFLKYIATTEMFFKNIFPVSWKEKVAEYEKYSAEQRRKNDGNI